MSNRYHRFESFKVLAHADRLAMIAEDKIPAPVTWVIYPSNACSYQCGHCIMAEEQKQYRAMLSPEAMAKVPGDAIRLGIKTVVFSGGGDPLLNPKTLETARALNAQGIPTGINNQGYFLDDPTPFSFIRFSVDAATPQTYERIHRVDGWDRVNTNISRVAKLRSNGAKIELGLAFLITPLNWEEAEDFVVWGQQYQPDFIHLRPAYLDPAYMHEDYTDGAETLQHTIIPRMAEMKERVERVWSNVFFRTDKFEGFWTPKQYSKCRANPLMAVTAADGSFLICQDRGIGGDDAALRWGNYNEQSFEIGRASCRERV